MFCKCVHHFLSKVFEVVFCLQEGSPYSKECACSVRFISSSTGKLSMYYYMAAIAVLFTAPFFQQLSHCNMFDLLVAMSTFTTILKHWFDYKVLKVVLRMCCIFLRDLCHLFAQLNLLLTFVSQELSSSIYCRR